MPPQSGATAGSALRPEFYQNFIRKPLRVPRRTNQPSNPCLRPLRYEREHWPAGKMRRPEYIAIVISRADQPQRQVAPQKSRQGLQKFLCTLGVNRSFVPAVCVGCKTKGIVIYKRAMVIRHFANDANIGKRQFPNGCAIDPIANDAVTEFKPSRVHRVLLPNDEAQQPGPLRNLWTPKNRNAAPVCCSDWLAAAMVCMHSHPPFFLVLV